MSRNNQFFYTTANGKSLHSIDLEDPFQKSKCSIIINQDARETYSRKLTEKGLSQVKLSLGIK